MFERYTEFLRRASVNGLSRAGVVLTTSAAATYILLELARFAGLIQNAYAGLVLYLVFPPLFVLGLLLIPAGWWIEARRRGERVRDLFREEFRRDFTEPRPLGSPLFKTIGLLTLANVVILGLVSMRTLHFMDTPRFCGTACHSVMDPEWTTYQQSPHARVACVDCHVGEGPEAMFEAKMRGLYQVLSVTLNLYEKPIPTPVHTLRPARETCETCHWPEKFYGTQLQTYVRYERDESTTPRYTTLNLKIDAGQLGHRSGIHWHIAQNHELRYASVDDQRKRMIWVEVEYPDGSVHRYQNRRLEGHEEPASHTRVMDCVDCHNRATHIYEDPDRALDERIRVGDLDRSLPYIKKVARRAITLDYPDHSAAMEGIENALHGFYRRKYPDLAARKLDQIDQAVATLEDLYERNIHHEMNIDWGAYPSHLGHARDAYGCFRCHNADMVDSQGTHVRNECTLCHSILALDSNERFEYLDPPAEDAPERDMHRYLREEFLHSEATIP
jgi:nitrate/TMAO reductase-like tetraheme cytochrome c subunit